MVEAPRPSTLCFAVSVIVTQSIRKGLKVIAWKCKTSVSPSSSLSSDEIIFLVLFFIRSAERFLLGSLDALLVLFIYFFFHQNSYSRNRQHQSDFMCDFQISDGGGKERHYVSSGTRASPLHPSTRGFLGQVSTRASFRSS